MSHDPNLAMTVPASPLVLGGLAAGVVVLVVAVVLIVRKLRARKSGNAIWTSAAAELGIDLIGDGSELGPAARGKVNDHVITIAPVAVKKGRKRMVSTGYSVKYEAPEAPKFILIKRTTATKRGVLDTGNPKFDGGVEVVTDNPEQFATFFTPARRTAALRLLTYWPSAEITNRATHLATPDIEADSEAIVNTVCHLVASAATFDRPTARDGASQSSAMDQTAAAAPGSVDELHGDSTVLTVVRLDEQSVIRELFDAGLNEAETAARFAQQFQGREVTWTGEVVRVGEIGEGGVQRIAALIGSADGQDPNSGRVVAITNVDADLLLSQGDVHTFTGAMVNLNVDQRLFHLV